MKRNHNLSSRFRRSASGILLIFFTAIFAAPANSSARDLSGPDSSDAQGRNKLPSFWWERAAAIRRMALKAGTDFPQLSLRPSQAANQLDHLRAEGITALEVFAPMEGGGSFDGLDSKNLFRIDPELGTMQDFRRLIRLAHSKRIAVIAALNLGYASVEAPFFLKASDDVKKGKRSQEASWFLWSDGPDAPPPGTNNRYFMVRPNLPHYNAAKTEFWQYSDRARHYYWTKWAGVDDQGKHVRLPQYNWASTSWQNEAAKAVRFWMDTGLDGIILDAVNWYVGITWELNRRDLTDIISSYGNTYSEPEGAGGFQDDPVAWITEGGWKAVQDYGLGIWWEKGTDVIKNAILRGDPRPIEAALRNYHDRVVRAGGSLYEPVRRYQDTNQQHLAFVTAATTGDMLCFCGGKRDLMEPDAEETRLLKLKQGHAALQQRGMRRKLPTQSDEKYYAFLRSSPDRKDRVLVVLNFQPRPEVIRVDTSGVAASKLVDLKSGGNAPVGNTLRLELPAYGYRLFAVLSIP